MTTTSKTDASTVSTSNSKVCITCGHTKPLTDFFDDRTYRDGKSGECKTCHHTRTSANRLLRKMTPARKFLANLEERWQRAINAIATPRCNECDGGMTRFRAGTGTPRLCRCVYRKIFSDIMQAYELARASAGTAGEVVGHHVPGFGGGVTYSRKNQEYVADVELLLKRVCTRLDAEYKDIFAHHWIVAKLLLIEDYSVEWVLRKLHLTGENNRRMVLFAASRIKMQTAITAVETEPYALFPVHEYFNEHVVHAAAPSVSRMIGLAIHQDSLLRQAAQY